MFVKYYYVKKKPEEIELYLLDDYIQDLQECLHEAKTRQTQLRKEEREKDYTKPKNNELFGSLSR